MDTTEQELDLALAAELQAALLPKFCPADCPQHVAAARNRMCGSVGGDFYDFIRVHEDQYAVVIGDVAGHGVRSSLVMAQIMGWFRSSADMLSRPVETVTALNRMLIQLGERTGTVTPCSLIYMVLDAPTGIAFFVNAGHPRPFLCDRGKCKVLHLGQRNMLLGVQDFPPEEDCHTFLPGERMVLYTDGVSDVRNPEGECFGERRLAAVVHDYVNAGPQQCADALFRETDRFRRHGRQSDDETVLVIDRVKG